MFPSETAMSELPFRLVPLFAGLSTEQLEVLSNLASIRHYKKNTIVLAQGDDSQSLFLILAGQLKVFVNDDNGKEMTLDFLNTGDYVGELALFDPAPRTASAITTEDTRLAVLAGGDFMAYLREYPQVALAMLPHLARRFRSITQSISNLGLLDVYGRVAQVLLAQSSPLENGTRITHRLTHQDIASLVGSSREMVTRILKDLREGGYISLQDKRITINRELPKRW